MWRGTGSCFRYTSLGVIRGMKEVEEPTAATRLLRYPCPVATSSRTLDGRLQIPESCPSYND